MKACIATPHALASEAGRAVLADGGNALDAAVAANLVLAVVTPYHCGLGGDLFAMLWDGEETHRSGEQMPLFGPLTVTVPGAVRGWFDLLERYGTQPFARLAEPAIALAREGFTVGAIAAEYVARSRQVYEGEETWTAIFGSLSAGDALRQPDLVRALRTLAADGPDAFYLGPIARAIVAEISMRGGLLEAEDLAGHAGEWCEPLEAVYRDARVLELPPPTQGATALEALRIAEAVPTGVTHERIEAMKLALADRDAVLTDPAWMEIPVARLLAPEHIEAKRAMIDPERARMPLPGRTAGGGTAFLCAADERGMMVSLIQSNWIGFGSGIVVPGWGIGLHNRGAYFSLDPRHPNAIAPRKRTLHTLIPAMAFRGGEPWLAFGSMGGDGQAQTHLQLLGRIADEGLDPQAAVDAPRWVVRTPDWSVIAEERFEASLIEDLRARGHRVTVTGPYDSVMGHAHAIERLTDGGYEAGSDPRAEGAALGI